VKATNLFFFYPALLRYRVTILNVFGAIILLSCITRMIVDYEELSKGEGWGMVGMFGIAGIGLAILVVDLIIQFLFRK